MRDIAIATKTQQELMATLLSKSQKDSHTVKILTVIALIYLPASLVAVSLLAHSWCLPLYIPPLLRNGLTDDLAGGVQLESGQNDKC